MAAARRRDVDLAVLAGEAQRVPLLLLALVPAAPGLTDDLARNVIGEPARHLAEFLDRLDVGLLVELAQRRLVGVLALVDAALRHLPDMVAVDVFRPAGAATDEDEPSRVEHHDAGAGTVG